MLLWYSSGKICEWTLEPDPATVASEKYFEAFLRFLFDNMISVNGILDMTLQW